MGSVIALPITFISKLWPESISSIVCKCKLIIAIIYIKIFNYLHSKRLDLSDTRDADDSENFSSIATRKEYELESPSPKSHLLRAKDEIFFYGVNSKNERLVISISRRCDQKADARVYLKLESGKTYSLVKTTDVEQVGVDSHVFSCGQLQLHYSSPMRRWRLFYNGYLRETDENGTERPIYVKFALLWIASSDIYDFSEDIDKKILAKWLAEVKWKGFLPPLIKLQKAMNSYGQSGVIQGTINVGEELNDYEIYLFGQRMRDLGSNIRFENMEFHHFLGYTEKNGMLIHLGELYIPGNVKNLSFGYVIQPDSSLKGLTAVSVKLDDQLLPAEGKRIKAVFTAERSHDLNGVLRGLIKQDTSDRSVWSDTIYETSFELDGKKGHGFYLRRKLVGVSDIKTSFQPMLKMPTEIPRTVTFTDVECQIPEITGGKGSSLGKLTHLSKELQTFIVPEGIVVTTSSYEEIITKDILSKIKLLEDVLYGNVDGDVKASCKRVQTAISECQFPNLVKLSIEKDLKKVFGAGSLYRFAVRSSATGEDTEQMSAAGQMDTFLGVSGMDEIIRAVKKCWASQFSYVAVQYKRRYGQCLNSPMAVVIQRMVACDTAGVLFTCDPLTGNPTVITITANYGLGESVVSGSEEPDTIILERDINNQLREKSTDIGAKSNRIIMREDGGTCEEIIPENQKNVCCISKEMALRLGHLAIKIEKCYKSARDIEWGYHNNNLYIFQSRPVTSGSSETTYEIDHEFDGALRVENDFFSTSNVGEVLVGPVSPLGHHITYGAFRNVSKEELQTAFQPRVRARYYSYGFGIYYNHSIFNVADVFNRMDGDNLDNITKSSLIGFFGKIPDDKDMFAVVKERYGGSVQENNWKSSYLFFKNLLFSRRQLESTLKAYEGHGIPVEECESSRKMLDLLLRRIGDLTDAFMIHMICSELSSIWNMFILSSLGEENGCFDDNVYRDFANLLRTHSEVESADVPAAMQSLAFHLSKQVNPKEFKSKTPKEALQWLQNSSSLAGIKFRQFIEKHGHRCLNEFDIRSKTWGSNPLPLVKLLQDLSGNVSVEKSDNKSPKGKESEFQVKLGFKSKLKMKFLLPLSRSAVQDRERSKSLLIKVVDSFRKGYNELAKRMVSEGRIPESDLIFFMTLEEIRELLDTRSPRILARASQRQRRHPILKNLRFPEMMKGPPKPIIETEEPIIHTDDYFSMTGIPVSQGVAKGYVRKIIRLEEAPQLQHGEILLTTGTDIGWTPYFPALAGVVTELGGLISHGAVVSREFGIPCIAGLRGATRHFQTGDYVILDGNKGMLQKIPPPAADSF